MKYLIEKSITQQFKVEKFKQLRVFIKVEMYAEELYGSNREKAIEGTFVFVALDKNQKPKQLNFNKMHISSIETNTQ